jgi:hypothetical protein
MTSEEITKYLAELNDELRLIGVKGEVSLYGGAVMCLVYDARPATKDVDAIFKPTEQIRKAVARITDRYGLNGDWLNDAVKGYWVEHQKRVLFDMPNLTVFVPEPDYLLAMKSIAARDASYDREDVRTLIKVLGLTEPEEVFAIIEKYYPRNQIKPATQFFIEEIFQK